MDPEHTDIDWILKNWNQIRDRVPVATMGKLIELLGLDPGPGNWRNHYAITMFTKRFLDPVLSTGDRDKLNEFLRSLEAANKETK